MQLPIRDKHGNQLTQQQVIQKVLFRFENIVLELEIFILHLVGHLPCHHVRRLFYRSGGMKIGKGTSIHMGTRFYDVRNIEIGEDTVVGEDAVLDGRAKLCIGDHVAIASQVMIYNSHHDINDSFFAPVEKPVSVGDYVFIGPRAIILPGVTIGHGAVVAAGAVVTKYVAPMTVVGGVPAKQIGKRNTGDLHYKIGRARWFR